MDALNVVLRIPPSSPLTDELTRTAKAFLAALPKCEHHMHIEGALEPETLFELSEKNGIPLDPRYYSTPAALRQRYKEFTGLDDFLFYRNMATAVLLTEENFETLAYAYMKRAHAEGVHHAEVFVDPQAHTSRGVPLSVVMDGLDRGLKRGEKEFGMTAMLVACLEKHRSLESAFEMVKDVAKYVESGTVFGLGMDSTEKGNPPEKYAGVYESARALGYPHFTAHAGEEGPAESVRTAVFKMGITRIDHGTNATSDPDLMKELAERKVFFTCCPLSNVHLRVIGDVSQVPILKLMDAGVKFSLNSDDPSYFSGLLENYFAVQKAFRFTKNVWAGLMADAIEGSWCGTERKAQMLKALDKVMKAYADRDL